MAIAIIGMIDEREEALRLLKDRIEKKGHKPLLVDISIGTGAIMASLNPDITCKELARSGGTTIDSIKGMLAKERDQAIAMMTEGLSKKLLELYHSGELEGVIAVGGITGSVISLSAMKLLPFGIPKLLISSVASMPAYARKFAEFYGVRDITVMHTVVDTVGLNPLVKNLMVNGAGAICGMVEEHEPLEKDEKPSIAITEFGFCDKGAHYVREFLEKHYNVISFHATGVGDRVALDFFGQGLFDAFIDGLKENLDTEISIIEIDTHINTPEFAESVVDALHEAM